MSKKWFENNEILEREPLCYVGVSGPYEDSPLAFVQGYDEDCHSRFLTTAGDFRYARPFVDSSGCMRFRFSSAEISDRKSYQERIGEKLAGAL